jgi:hypothetical protein
MEELDCSERRGTSAMKAYTHKRWTLSQAYHQGRAVASGGGRPLRYRSRREQLRVQLQQHGNGEGEGRVKSEERYLE